MGVWVGVGMGGVDVWVGFRALAWNGMDMGLGVEMLV